MNLKSALKDEYLGMFLEVVASNNKEVVNLCGKIIDETKETFVLLTDDGQKKTLIKRQIKFKISKYGSNGVLPDGSKIEIDGQKICYRSYDRIKKIR